MPGMQVLGDKCFVKGANTLRRKERKLCSGGDRPAVSGERLPQTHALPQRANYTHVLYRFTLNGLESDPVHLISQESSTV